MGLFEHFKRIGILFHNRQKILMISANKIKEVIKFINRCDKIFFCKKIRKIAPVNFLTKWIKLNRFVFLHKYWKKIPEWRNFFLYKKNKTLVNILKRVFDNIIKSQRRSFWVRGGENETAGNLTLRKNIPILKKRTRRSWWSQTWRMGTLNKPFCIWEVANWGEMERTEPGVVIDIGFS